MIKSYDNKELTVGLTVYFVRPNEGMKKGVITSIEKFTFPCNRSETFERPFVQYTDGEWTHTPSQLATTKEQALIREQKRQDKIASSKPQGNK